MVKCITFEVIGDQRLHCESCEQRVKRLLKGVQGVRQVRADATSQRIEVLFEAAELEETAIVERLLLLGYRTEAAIRSGCPSGEIKSHLEKHDASD